MGARTKPALPDVLKDADLNRFIISVLEGAKGDENGEHSHYARIGNVQIDRTVEQLRAFFPEREESGDDGEESGNVTAFADRVGA
jgi:hypothetical protein